MDIIIGLIIGVFFGMLILGVLTASKVSELEDENYKLRLKYKANWIANNKHLMCSKCDASYDIAKYKRQDFPYCPKCGSEMENGKN